MLVHRGFFSKGKRAGCVLILAVSAIGCLSAWQDQPAEGTRQLYYLATSQKDPLPPVAPASVRPQAPKTGAVHLGLRYNIVLLDSSGARQPISSSRVLRTGDCFAIDIQSNRSGYLYVFAKQSSGSWRPLFPSPEMAGESNILDPGRKVQVPKGYCFTIQNPPGQETLFVVLSRDPRDFYELYEGFKARSGAPTTSAPAHTMEHLQLADAGKLNAAVEHLDERFATRDIAITRVDTPHENGEPAGSVYVVNTSDRPTSSIVTKIVIRHE